MGGRKAGLLSCTQILWHTSLAAAADSPKVSREIKTNCTTCHAIASALAATVA
jgi:hypothetical protein